jgi:vacuolar protein sorting-associated protein 13A/C
LQVITISPFYILQNDCAHDIEVREHGDQLWHRCASNSYIGIWPVQRTKRKTMCVRYVGQEEHSLYFPFTETFEDFCHIPNSYLGLHASVACGESSSVIKIEPFAEGMAPAILMNATKIPVRFQQSKAVGGGEDSWDMLRPGELRAFTWPDVESHQERLLEWDSGQMRKTDALVRNDFGSYMPAKTGAQHYWVSFLNGRQRVLLFTTDLAVMTTAYEAYEVERMNMQTELNIHGVGISLVNNLSGMEVGW